MAPGNFDEFLAKLVNTDKAFQTITTLDVHGTIDWLPTGDFEERMIRAVHSVGRIHVRGGNVKYGTGFLVGPHLLLTNNHVLPDKQFVRQATIWIDYDEPKDIPEHNYHEAVGVDLLRSSPEELLDYSLVSVKFPESETKSWTPSHINLRDHGQWPEPGKDSVIIVQHPDGGPRKIILDPANTQVLEVIGKRIWYNADTQPGSSGSPVLDYQFRVIGLHRQSYPSRNGAVDIRKILEDADDLIPQK